MATPDDRAASITRRNFFALGAGAASVVVSRAAAQSRSEPQSSQNTTVPGQAGLLYPRQNQVQCSTGPPWPSRVERRPSKPLSGATMVPYPNQLAARGGRAVMRNRRNV